MLTVINMFIYHHHICATGARAALADGPSACVVAFSRLRFN
jgi:hypothetical protein